MLHHPYIPKKNTLLVYDSKKKHTKLYCLVFYLEISLEVHTECTYSVALE